MDRRIVCSVGAVLILAVLFIPIVILYPSFDLGEPSISIGLMVLVGLGMVSGCLSVGFIVNTWSKMWVADQESNFRVLEALAGFPEVAWKVAEECVKTTKQDTGVAYTLKVRANPFRVEFRPFEETKTE